MVEKGKGAVKRNLVQIIEFSLTIVEGAHMFFKNKTQLISGGSGLF